MDARILALALGLTAAACGAENTSPVRPSSLAADVSSSPTPTTTGAVTPISGKLVFTSDRDGAYHIYSSIGSEVRRLAPGDRAKWSPNGTQIVYQAASPGSGIYIMNADGSGQRYLAAGIQPSWSPDGSQIVFMSGDPATGGIYVVDSTGMGLTRVVGFDVENGSPETPVWSPDRRTIAFIRANYDEPWQIYAVGLDGTPPRRLTNTAGGIVTQSEPEWSPDGSRIVFSTFNGIATMNADGTGWQSAGSGRLLDPDWTAAGFVVARYTGPGPTTLSGWEHRIFAIEGGNERQVVPDVTTGRRYLDIHPDWTR